MISSQDRSKWFGASDTAIIMGNWETKTFCLWWLEKCGARKNTFTNLAMQTGTHYEHKILDFLGITSKDRQIKIRRYQLRVNLDGDTKETIYEVKTHSADKLFKVTKAYWQQAQVEMFAAKRKLFIEAYALNPEDYENYFNGIDGDRLTRIEVPYDEDFIKTEYLPRLRYLKKCLKRGIFPRHVDFLQGKLNKGEG